MSPLLAFWHRLRPAAPPGRPGRRWRAAYAVTLLLLLLLAWVQAQLWWGRGGVPQVRELRANLQAQEAENQLARQRNAQLANEVRDLQDGLEGVEEVARRDLGLVRADEIFVQVRDTPLPAPAPVPAPALAPTPVVPASTRP